MGSKAPAHFPAHLERLTAFHERGDLLLVGTFGDPQDQGSMAISLRHARDRRGVRLRRPFVLNGVVASWEVRQ